MLDEAVGLSRSFPSRYTFEGLALIGLAIAEFDAGDIELARLYSADAAEHYPCSGFYEKESSSSLDIDGWLTEGQGLSLEEAIDAALEFEQRSQRSASRSYG